MFSPHNSSHGSGYRSLMAENSQFASPMMRNAMNDITPAAGNGIFENGESNGGGVPQFAPNFLFGAQHASKRRNLAFPVSRTAVGSPGILKAKEANLSPGAKNVHWSPLLVRERSVSPGSRKDEQYSKDRERSEKNAEALWNGPPLRSIRDDLGPPEKQVRLEQTPNCSASFNNVSSVHDFEGAETSFSAQSDRNFWVTVFGFSLDHASAILELFSKHGNIVSQKAPKVGNYIHIRYSSMVHAKQALARNAKIFDGMMIGVVPCSDRDIVGEEGVAIPASSSVYVFNASSNDANKDGVPDGSRMVPSVSGTQNMSLPNRSRFSISSRAGMRPLNTSFASDTSGNLNSSSAQKAENSFLGKFWNYVYN